MGAFHLPQDALGCSNLVRTHHQQGITDIKHRKMQQDIEQGVLLKKGGSEIFKIFDQAVVGLCLVHRKIKAVLIALCGVGKIAAVGAI